jgi:addiction module HigA family antidote
MSAYELVKRLHVPVPRVNHIVVKRRGISADTAVRLSRFFGTTEQFWLNLQGAYEVSRVLPEETAEIEQSSHRRCPPPGKPWHPRSDERLAPLSSFLSRPSGYHRRRNPASRSEFALHLGPDRLRPPHHIFQYLIYYVLLKNSQVTI